MTQKPEDFGRAVDALFKDVVDTLSKTILVVDDSMTMRRIIKRALDNLGSFTVLEAANGLEGLGKLQTADVALIISDWNMPEMNGLDFVKAVRAIARYAKTPILMVTTVNHKQEVYEAVKSGVNGYLVKPFKEEDLATKVCALLKYKN